ncbi:MAG: YeeE/YedE thiosulfate transporter family protein [Sphingobium limneticum]
MDWNNAMPVAGLTGGLLIGLACAIMLLGLGRIAGVSGLASRAFGISRTGAPWEIAAAFIVGLPVGAGFVSLISGPVIASFSSSLAVILIGGILVGFGTRMGSGCTSGHGICGLSRLSRRSIVATASFMSLGFATVAVMRLLGVPW